MFAETAKPTSSPGNNSGPLDCAGAAFGAGGAPGTQSPGAAQKSSSSSLPAAAAEGDGEEDEEEVGVAEEAPRARGLPCCSMLAVGTGLLLLLLAGLLVHWGQQQEREEAEEAAKGCLALLLLRLVLYLVCAASAFLLGTLLAFLYQSRGRLRPAPDFRVA